jgi:hypothetical protein
VAIVLVDAERTWSKSRYGLALAPTPRALAFCSRTVAGSGVLVVPRHVEGRALRGPPARGA